MAAGKANYRQNDSLIRGVNEYAVQRTEHRAAEDARDRLDADCIRIMQSNANTDYFHVKESTGGDNQLSALHNKGAITRLLALKLLRYDQQSNPDQGSYYWAYHWTHLGKLVLRLLGFSDHLAVKQKESP
jgi:hypothetical protein